MVVYEVRMFEVDSGGVIATYLGTAQSTPDAIRRCVDRAKDAGRIGLLEVVALKNKAFSHRGAMAVDTDRWEFTVSKATAKAL